MTTEVGRGPATMLHWRLPLSRFSGARMPTTARLEELVIPADLRPSDGRFGCGPTKVRQEAVDALCSGVAPLGTSHRKPPVRQLVGALQDRVRQLFDVPESYEVVLGNGGATAFWDAAAHALIERRSLHYVFGEFSAKFARATAAAPWLDGPVQVEAPVGSRPSITTDPDVDVQAMTHNETSTGVAMDISRADDDVLVLVDATSGAAGLPVDVTQTDAYYFSLQKGLASEGGLWVAILSPAAIDRIERLTADRYVPPSLDLTIALANSRKHQTYNTPAIATLFLAAHQLAWILERGGLAWSTGDCAAKADIVYRWADERDWASPFVTDPAARSNVVATIDLDGVDADDIQTVLRANEIVDSDSYRKLGRNQLRVGLFPAVEREDVVAYTRSVDWVVEQLG